MTHVIAILGFALLCGFWYLVQRWSGKEAEIHTGTCGVCGREPDPDDPDCQRRECPTKELEGGHAVENPSN